MSGFDAATVDDGAQNTAGSILDDIEEKINASSLDNDTRSLWLEIRASYEEDGPEGVKSVIEERVQRSKRAVEKDLRETRLVTKSATPKKKSVAKKAAVRKGPIKK